MAPRKRSSSTSSSSTNSGSGAKRKRKNKKESHAIKYKQRGQFPPYRDVTEWSASRFEKYRMREEQDDLNLYAGKELTFFPYTYENKVLKDGDGVELLAFGVLDNGTSACVRALNFAPHMYVALPTAWVEYAKENDVPLYKIVAMCQESFSAALSHHIDRNQKHANRFRKLNGTYMRDVLAAKFLPENAGRTDVPPAFFEAKDGYGYCGDDVITVMRFEFTDPALVPIARELWSNPLGTPVDRCAICDKGLHDGPDGTREQFFVGHKGSCLARYHRRCITQWLVDSHARETYYQMEEALDKQASSRRKPDDPKQPFGFNEDVQSEREALWNDVHALQASEELYDGANVPDPDVARLHEHYVDRTMMLVPLDREDGGDLDDDVSDDEFSDDGDEDSGGNATDTHSEYDSDASVGAEHHGSDSEGSSTPRRDTADRVKHVIDVPSCDDDTRVFLRDPERGWHLRRRADCHPNELIDGFIAADDYQLDMRKNYDENGKLKEQKKQSPLGACCCCRGKIFNLVPMTSEALEERLQEDLEDIENAWRNIRYRYADWYHECMEPAMAAAGLLDLPMPEPVDMLGEEAVGLSKQLGLTMPRPRFSVYESNIDFKVTFLADCGLKPSTWWRLPGTAKIGTVPQNSYERRSVMATEFTIDARDIVMAESLVSTYELMFSDMDTSPDAVKQWAPRDRWRFGDYLEIKTTLAEPPPLVECSMDAEMQPKVASYLINGQRLATNRGNGFPTPDADPVLNIGMTFYNHRTSERKRLCLCTKDIERSSPEAREFLKTTDVIWYDTEADMLANFCILIRSARPDIFSGYNIAGFDVPYIVNRALDEYNISDALDIGCKMRGSSVYWQQDFKRNWSITKLQLRGTLVLDYLPWYMEQKTARSYSLNAVADSVLGERKMDMPYSKIPECQLTARGRLLLAMYVVRDSELPIEIGLRMKAVATLFNFSKLSRAPAQELLYRGTQYKVLSFIQYAFRKNGMESYGLWFLIPTLDRAAKTGEIAYTGAIVFKPDKGIYAMSYPPMLSEDEIADTSSEPLNSFELDLLMHGAVKRETTPGDDDPMVVETEEVDNDASVSIEPDPAPPATRKRRRPYQFACPRKRATTDEGATTGRRVHRTSTTQRSNRLYGFKGPLATLDYASLYPSVMQKNNICLTTMITEYRRRKYGYGRWTVPFIHPGDVTEGYERPHERLVDKDGNEYSWETLPLAAEIRAALKRAVEFGELHDHCQNVQHPRERALYYEYLSVWGRPKFEFDQATKRVRLVYQEQTPMFVTQHIRHGVIPKEQAALRDYRVGIRSAAKPIAAAASKHAAYLKANRDALSPAECTDIESEIRSQRLEVERINIEQLNVKLLMNSIYGFLGAPESPMPSKWCAESITLTGQYYAKTAEAIACGEVTLEHGYRGNMRVAYGDTDSVFVYMEMDEPVYNTKVYSMDLSKYICKRMNACVGGGAISLEFEKIFVMCVLIAPKFYFGIKVEDNGRLSTVFKGIRARRRDSNKVELIVAKQVLDSLRNLDIDGAFEAVREASSLIAQHAVPMHWLSTSTSFSKRLEDPSIKETAGVVVARKRRDRTGEDLQPGDRMEMIMVEQPMTSTGTTTTKFSAVKRTLQAEDLHYAVSHKLRYDRVVYGTRLLQSLVDILLALPPPARHADGTPKPFDPVRNFNWIVDRVLDPAVFRDVAESANTQKTKAMRSLLGDTASSVAYCTQCNARLDDAFASSCATSGGNAQDAAVMLAPTNRAIEDAAVQAFISDTEDALVDARDDARVMSRMQEHAQQSQAASNRAQAAGLASILDAGDKTSEFYRSLLVSREAVAKQPRPDSEKPHRVPPPAQRISHVDDMDVVPRDDRAVDFDASSFRFGAASMLQGIEQDLMDISKDDEPGHTMRTDSNPWSEPTVLDRAMSFSESMDGALVHTDTSRSSSLIVDSGSINFGQIRVSSSVEASVVNGTESDSDDDEEVDPIAKRAAAADMHCESYWTSSTLGDALVISYQETRSASFITTPLLQHAIACSMGSTDETWTQSIASNLLLSSDEGTDSGGDGGDDAAMGPALSFFKLGRRAPLAICRSCTQDALLNYQHADELWKSVFPAAASQGLFSESPDVESAPADHRAIARSRLAANLKHIHVMEVHPRTAPSMPDFWTVCIVPSKYGAKYMTPAARRRVRAKSGVLLRLPVWDTESNSDESIRVRRMRDVDSNPSALVNAGHSALLDFAGCWATCSMCRSVNLAIGDVASCATKECDINGLRQYHGVRAEHIRRKWQRFVPALEAQE